MSIYLYIVAATLILGAIMPQKGRERVFYIAVIAALHAFVCGFRYQHLTGDLMKYHHMFNTYGDIGWFSDEILQEGRNTGFQFLMKLVNHLTGGDFQILLILIAVITHGMLAVVIYRYSPAPWMSFLLWDCMAIYIFGFSAIKQALAMSFVMLAFMGLAEDKPRLYWLGMLLAGFTHTPALVFLPAYWLTKMRVTPKTIVFYLVLGLTVYVFRDAFVSLMQKIYYEEEELLIFSGDVGNRFVMLLGFTLFGVLFKGFPNRDHEKLFHIMAVSVILQMFSGYDNIFTRLADYYFQFSVLYLPLVFFPREGKRQQTLLEPVFPFNARSLKALALILSVFCVWYYYTFAINVAIDNSVDNYLNFRFMWDVP